MPAVDDVGGGGRSKSGPALPTGMNPGVNALASAAATTRNSVLSSGEAAVEAAVVAGAQLGSVGLHMVDRAIGLGCAVTSATAHAVEGALGASAAAAALQAAAQPLLRGIAKDPFTEPYRQRAWDCPERALETLEPYARLRLAVLAGRDLLARDLDGRSDPFAEVYLNDDLQGSSGWRFFTVNPTWDFHIDLDIYSPLSVVQIRIMDRDNLKSNDVVGFVEFCVAELDPNEEVSGWFELRRKRHLHGLARARLRSHTKRRDDDPAKRARPAAGAAPPSDEASSCRVRSPARVLKPALSRCKTALSLCRGKAPRREGPIDDDDSEEPTGASTPSGGRRLRGVETRLEQATAVVVGEEDRPNAGEVRLQMRLEAAAEPDDEWFACCFPRPSFQVFPSGTLDLEGLYRDITDIKAMLLHTSQTALCVPRYLLAWKCWPLTALALAWWCVACLRPALVFPTALLWPALLLRLLRKEKWQEAMLVHERTAPLNERGFKAVAALNDTRRLEAWVLRVVGSMGRGVSDRRRLHELAALVARDGRPVLGFEALHQHLAVQPWVYHPSGPRKCPEGHALVFLGSVGGGHQWACQNPRGCGAYTAGGAWADVSRYHCVTCRVHICEPCVAQVTRPPLWTSMPTALFPESLELAMLHIEEPLDRLRAAMHHALSLATVPFQPDERGARVAKEVSKACVCACGALLVASWLLTGPLCFLVIFCLRAGMLLAGCACFVVELTAARRLVVWLRAHADFAEQQRRRAAGPLEQRWAFFAPDPAAQEGSPGKDSESPGARGCSQSSPSRWASLRR